MQNLLQMLPLNISLLILSSEHLKGMKQVSVLDIFDTTKNFHPEGLFSSEIFGKVGDERRNRNFAYIDLNIPVLHPLIYRELISLKELYAKIMAGTAFAVFNPKTKDFEESNIENGETGYNFFMSHFNELQFEERESTSREFSIKLINRERQRATMANLLVMPAGLRDFTVLPGGKPEEDEINNLYRRIISTANIVGSQSAVKDKSHLDSTRYSLQKSIQALYEYIVNILEGKTKMIQGNWTSRNAFYSTRNVITSNVSRVNTLFDDTTLDTNQTVAGMYQILRGIFPLAVNKIRDYSNLVFTGPNTPAYLVNAKTLEREIAPISPERYDEWMTQEGMETIFNMFEIEDLRHDEIMIEGKYFGLIYNDGEFVKFVQDIRDVPEEKRKDVKPITFAELFYLATAEEVKDIPALNTRYPITGFGSIYPSYLYMKSTTVGKRVTLLNEDWSPSKTVFTEFPIRGMPFVNSMSPSPSHISALTADYDGDTMSLTPVFTDEGREEVKKLLGSKNYYFGVTGRAVFSFETDTSKLVFNVMSS